MCEKTNAIIEPELTLEEICVCIHYHFTPVSYAVNDNNRLSVQRAENRLVDKGMLRARLGSEVLSTTDRGKVYVEAIRSLSLPVQSWKMP